MARFPKRKGRTLQARAEKAVKRSKGRRVDPRAAKPSISKITKAAAASVRAGTAKSPRAATRTAIQAQRKSNRIMRGGKVRKRAGTKKR